MVGTLFAEAEFVRDLAGHFVRDAFVDIDFCRDDGIGRFFGYSFNVHSSLAGSDDHGALTCAVHEDGEVEFSTREFALHDEDGVADSSLFACLFCDEFVADHLVCEYACFSW